jgi:hypothetical protein
MNLPSLMCPKLAEYPKIQLFITFSHQQLPKKGGTAPFVFSGRTHLTQKWKTSGDKAATN